MFEAKLTITAPGLEAALNNLAAAIAGAKTQNFAPNVAVTPNPTQTAPVPTPAAPAPAPAAQTASPAGPTSAYPSNAPAPAPVGPAPGSIPTASAPAPMPGPAPQPAAPASYPAPAVPLAPAPQYTVDQIMAAGATLMDAGKVNELLNLLHSFGVQAVTDLKPEQLGAFATAMRELGAKI